MFQGMLPRKSVQEKRQPNVDCSRAYNWTMISRRSLELRWLTKSGKTKAAKHVLRRFLLLGDLDSNQDRQGQNLLFCR